MHRVQTFPISDDMRGTVVAIGNFDGVHLGHRAVLDQAKSIAQAQGAPLGVLTFEPHPRSYFAAQNGTDTPPFRLMDAETRATRLAKLGVDIVFEYPFDALLSALTPDAFCTDVLAHTLGVSHVLVGADFCFGKGRAGNVPALINLCRPLDICVTVADLAELGDDTISSTNIRRALSKGNPRKAAAMLGHW
ncbi:MAG: FAD synthetase family protein, partial [Pseudomonadota bacterium]